MRSKFVRALALWLAIFNWPFAVNGTAMADWIVIAERLEKSVMQISNWCSAFSIDDDRDYALTAKHCTSEDPAKPTIVDLIPSRVVADDAQYDLTVLHVPGMDRKAIPLAAEEPKPGSEAGTWGFGYGLKRPSFSHVYVSNRRVTFPELDGEWVKFNGAFEHGQSGSPVVNADGELVAVVQMTTDRSGLGRGVDIVRDRVGKWFAKPKQP